jgi:hypothetical protein
MQQMGRSIQQRCSRTGLAAIVERAEAEVMRRGYPNEACQCTAVVAFRLVLVYNVVLVRCAQPES